MMHRVLVLVVLCAVSCESKTKSTQQQTAPTVVKPSAEPVPNAAPDLAEADVLALVKQWLAAQTSGDFAAYANLYAERMTGIKRVGSKESRYNREGWLKDRKRMFGKPMTVAAADLSVQSSSTSAVVRFEQTWASGTFKDVGAKQLIVVREGDALRIAREEMLNSAVLSSKHGVPGELEDLLFGAPGLDGFIVGPAEKDWGAGAVELKGTGPYLASRKASRTELPDKWKDLTGSSITVYQGGGACQDTISALDIVVGVTPHFSFFTDENGEFRQEDAALAQDIFDMESAYLVARTKGDCVGHVAQLGANPRTLAPVTRVEVPALKNSVLAALRKTEEFAALQADYRDYETESGEKNTGSWVAEEAVSLFATGATHFAIVSMRGGGGCGEFEGSLSAVYELRAQGPAKLVGVLDGFFVVQDALDFDGDGNVEFIGNTSNFGVAEMGLIGRPDADTEYQMLSSFAWPYHDCPC